jgi:hypothetical protein
MANLGNFNADDFEDSYDPVPAGEYTVIIASSEWKSSSKGDQMLKVTAEIVDGSFKGRKLFSNLNLNNPNPDAKKIAQVALADICRSVGVLHPKDSSELHGKPLTAKVAVAPETDRFPAGNDIKRWKPVARPAAAASSPKAAEEGAPEETASKPASGKKPWEK